MPELSLWSLPSDLIIGVVGATSWGLSMLPHFYSTGEGSLEVDYTVPVILKAEINDDQLSVWLRVDGLQIVHLHEITGKGAGVAHKDRLLHDAAWYNLQQLPKFD